MTTSPEGRSPISPASQEVSPEAQGRSDVLPTSAEQSLDTRGCRFCDAPLRHVVVDLGLQPLCQSLVTLEDLNKYEICYPLRAYVCDHCWLVQVHEHVSGEEIFSDYAYFSSYSDSWIDHARRYVDLMTERLGLDETSRAIEIASNDGYLLQWFRKKNIPALGIEPAANVARAAMEKGIDCLIKFFGSATARDLVAQGIRADLLIANNVLAHVPDLNDFVAGMKIVLAERGVITVECPHLLCLIEENQFDTIYQEHYCYFSLLTLRKIFSHHGLKIFDVDRLPTHGGSLRIHAAHAEDQSRSVSPVVEEIQAEEEAKGLDDLAIYRAFSERVAETKRKLLTFLIEAKRAGKRVAGYGAPGKGNTLLNYCGIREDFIDYTVDRNPVKQNTFLVGSRIPVYRPEMIRRTRPDYVLLLPWNLKDELAKQLEYVREWGGKLVVPIPELTILD